MKNWKEYQNKTYNKDVCELLKIFLNEYKVESAIDLGTGSGNETVYMAKKGINVIAIDRQLNEKFILDRLNDKQKEKVTFQQQEFENIKLEKVDVITAFFSIPFCNPKYFNELWDKIYNSINEDGYFVGQLFGDRDDWKDAPLINIFTIEQVKEYLKKYEIIKLEEVEYVRKMDNKKWHYYNIIAKKR